tara:strand:+ start:359 stop:1681 length:1323 start_codon:yes stop_codon:yes gene_type:complete
MASAIISLVGALGNMGGILDSITSAMQGFGETVMGAFNSVKEAVMGVWDTITGAFSNIGDFLSDPVGYFTTETIESVETMNNEITDGFAKVGQDAADLADTLEDGIEMSTTQDAFASVGTAIGDTQAEWEHARDMFEEGADVAEMVSFMDTTTGEIINVGDNWEVLSNTMGQSPSDGGMIEFRNSATGELATVDATWKEVTTYMEGQVDSGMVREFQNANGELAVFDDSWNEIAPEVAKGLGYTDGDKLMFNATTGEVAVLDETWNETKASMEGTIESAKLHAYYDELDARIGDSAAKFAQIFGVNEKDVHITIDKKKKSGNWGGAAAGALVGGAVAGPVGAVIGGAIGFFADDGGVFTGPKSGYMGMLHGTEAVVPLPDGRSIPVKMSGNGGGNTFNITVNAGGITDRTDKRQMAREIGNQIQQEMARSMGVSTTRGAF